MEGEYLDKRGAKVFGIDISLGQLECGTQRNKLHGCNIRFICADARKLPFKDDSFDIGFAYEGLHHLPNPQNAIGELARICTETIIFFEPVDTPITKTLIYLGFVEKEEPSRIKPYRFKELDVKRILSELGFNKIEISRCFFYFPEFLNMFKDNDLFLTFFKFSFFAANAIFGKFGHRMFVVAKR
jgi:ubiquinone/menaquinone biosynthesis C-methylase UbiE